MRRGSGERSGVERLLSSASTPTTAGRSLSPFTSLDTSLVHSLDGYGDYDEDSTAFVSPASFSLSSYHSHTNSLTRASLPAVASPILILGDVSEPVVFDHEVQPEMRQIPEVVQLPAKSSQALSAPSLRSSLFSYITDSLTSAESLLPFRSSAFVTSPSSAAPPGEGEPLQRTGSSLPHSQPTAFAPLSAVHEAGQSSDLREERASLFSSSLSSSAVLAEMRTTSSFSTPPPLVSASAMTTQVLPSCTDDEGRYCSRASPPAMESSPLLLCTPRTASRPQVEERELERSGSSAKDLSVADVVSTLPLTALDELPPPTPLPSSLSFSASPSTAPPLSAVAASPTETPVRPSLSHLATSLLCADDADPLADQWHTKSRINTTELPWVPMLLPAMPAPKRRQRVQTDTSPPLVEGHNDAQGVGLADGNPVAKRRRIRKRGEEGALPTSSETVSVAERGVLAAASLSQPPSSRRRQTTKAATEDNYQSAVTITPSNIAGLGPMPKVAGALDQKENCDSARGPTETSTDHPPASRNAPEHIFQPSNSSKLSAELHSQGPTHLAGDDVPLFNLFTAGSDAGVSLKLMASAAYQPSVTPSVPSQSQGNGLRRKRSRKAEIPRTSAAAEDVVAPSVGRAVAKASREEMEAAPRALTALPLSSSSPPAPQLTTQREKLDDGRTKDELPANGSTSAAASSGATGQGKTPISLSTLPPRNRRKRQKTLAAATGTPSCTRSSNANGSNGAGAQAISTEKRAAGVQSSVLQARRSAVCTSASSFESGRCCLWIELSEGYQEAHGTLLRQVLMYWGWLHSESCASQGGGLALPVGSSPLPSNATPKHPSRKRSGDRKCSRTSAAGASAQIERTDRRANNALVVLLCPSPLSVGEALRWWTQRAHVEHSFIPPLLAVSMSADSPSSVVGRSDRVPSASPAVPTPDEEYALFRDAIQLTSSVYNTNADRSFAVSCSAAGHAALAQLLSLDQVFDSMQVCADVLRSAAGIPLTSLPVKTPVVEDAEVSSQTAVLAVSALMQNNCSGSASERGRASSLQERCFAELCQWNGLAAELQRQPRRPQLVLRRVRVDPMHQNGGTSKRNLACPPVSHAALMGASANVLPASSVTGPSLSPEERPKWVTFGMVLPAMRNEDTFASSARREDRVLASQPPPVVVAPAHLAVLHLFARVLFTPDNYVTAVNVVESYARASHRCLTDYLSDYSCAMTGPLRYSASATIRRYLQVRVLVELAPLLALVKEEIPAQKGTSTGLSVGEACVSYSSASTLAAPVVLLARLKWRTVVLSLSCTCTPRLYEQVPHTDDGEKVCRHIAELFHYFTTQQFSVIGHQTTQREQPLSQHQAKREPARADPMLYSQSLPVSPGTTSSEKRHLTRRRYISTNTSNSSAKVILSSLPLSAPCTHSSDLCADSEGASPEQERDEVSGSDSSDSASSAQHPARYHSRQCGSTPALSPTTSSKTRQTRPLKKAQRSSTVTAANTSVASSVAASAAGTDFHTQALQYALLLLRERLRDGTGEGPVDDGAVCFAEAATGDDEFLFQPSGTPPPARPRKRARSKGVSQGDTEHVRALQLVEKLLRDQLS
ncbi:hypothetical protein, conserved [Leishmania tarentolae]|uniref:SWIM-type domain-containing protein n=1 Tax=Leishmania tarentolae TaxID=5689 RepID=A0A640KPM2_LEITA|nr:hypothetical protein, conserved [Leishmania tarentolae]